MSDKYQELAAVAYQILGQFNVPAEVLDVFCKAANGEDFGDPMDLLPFEAPRLTDETFEGMRRDSLRHTDSQPVLVEEINQFFLMGV